MRTTASELLPEHSKSKLSDEPQVPVQDEFVLKLRQHASVLWRLGRAKRPMRSQAYKSPPGEGRSGLAPTFAGAWQVVLCPQHCHLVPWWRGSFQLGSSLVHAWFAFGQSALRAGLGGPCHVRAGGTGCSSTEHNTSYRESYISIYASLHK